MAGFLLRAGRSAPIQLLINLILPVFPNVVIGRRCSIGVNTIVRKNRVIPDGSKIGTPAGLPMRAVAKIERDGEAGSR